MSKKKVAKASSKKVKASSRPKAKSAAKAKATPPEARAVGEHELEIFDEPVEVVEKAAPIESQLSPTVACRYCGAEIPRPSDGSTFFTCGCVDTGSLTTNKYGKAVAS